jgi:hypothetical protein
MINCIEYTQKHIVLSCCISAFVTFGLGLTCSAAETDAEKPSWEMVKGNIVTRWAKEVSPTNALPEYPRPMMRRERWKNLNGLWEFTMRPKSQASRPDKFDDQILVPFCVESALSGVKKKVVETDMLWYRRTFDVPRQWAGQRLLLHFGAVDWETTVWVKLGNDRLGQWQKSWGPPRWLRSVFFRYYRYAESIGFSGDRCGRLGPHRQGPAGARQTANHSRRLHVYARVGHLADGLD